MKAAAKFVVKGTVQGIFFRKFAKEKADELSLKGHVRNLANGDVEVLVEGDSDNINRMESLLNEGPQYSQVRSVERSEQKWSGDFSEFKVIRF